MRHRMKLKLRSGTMSEARKIYETELQNLLELKQKEWPEATMEDMLWAYPALQSRIESHWKEFRPKELKTLKAGNLLQLMTAVRANRLMNMVAELERAGFRRHEAMHMAEKEYLYLPEES